MPCSSASAVSTTPDFRLLFWLAISRRNFRTSHRIAEVNQNVHQPHRNHFLRFPFLIAKDH